MFNEIKHKITLFNILTLIAFLSIYIVLIGFLVGWLLGYSGEIYLKESANKVIEFVLFENHKRAPKPIEDEKNLRSQVGYDFIIWDEMHNAFKEEVSDIDLVRTAHEMELRNDPHDHFDKFSVSGSYYRSFSTSFEMDDRMFKVQVFQNIDSEKRVIRYVVVFLLLIGVLGVLVLIPISYFLAGKSVQPIKETFDQQKKFIADASHELRTPLTVIQTNVEVLRLKEDEVLANNIHWLNNIQMESETMAHLIKELLIIAQVDNKKVVMEKAVFDLSALCAEIVDLMYDFAIEQHIHLKGVIPKGIEYYGDYEKLKQAIRILVDNAIKYTPEEGKVTLTLLDSSRSVIIAVQDTGVGLSEEDQKKIFGRFYRVDDARHRESGGAGLGLNIADMIVKQHNGRIEIDSMLNEGSTFSIVLPKNSLKNRDRTDLDERDS